MIPGAERRGASPQNPPPKRHTIATPESDQASPFTWLNPTRVVFGDGRLADLPEVVAELAGGQARVLLVTGRRSLRASGVLDEVFEMLGRERVTLFDRVTPFPSPELVDGAVALCRETSPDVIVAVGGGSAIDLAKAVAALVSHDGTAREYAQGVKDLRRRGMPFVAVPTTSGSSSEVTSGAALWDMNAKEHMGLGSPLMFPDVAIVDPALAATMPREVAAASGMDAFTSAFESYWSTEAQPLSDSLNLEVIRLFSRNLERSCNDGDRESRAACALAATMSGIAYSNSRPNVCHAVGSPLTLYWNVDHGQSVGLTLTTFLRSQAEAISHKLPALWDAMGVSDLEEAVHRLTAVMAGCGLETRLGPLGVDEDGFETLLEHTRWDRLATLPRPLDREAVSHLLRRLL